MLEFLVENMFVILPEKSSSRQSAFQLVRIVPSSPRILSLFIQSGFHTVFALSGKEKKQFVSRFNLTYSYIDNALSINNPQFENYLGQMYPAEFEIKKTTESTTSASYLDLLLPIWRDCQLHTSIYDKRDAFNFHITNFPFLSRNVTSSPAYGVYISQLMRCDRACCSYECFILRAMWLSSKLLKQGYLVERLKSSFRKFYGRYSAIWSIPSTNVKWNSDPRPTVASELIRRSINIKTFILSLTFTKLWVVSMKHLHGNLAITIEHY